MSDNISRQAAMEHYSTGEIAHCNHVSRNNLLDFIEQLPPVTPQQRTGRWIEVIDKIRAEIDSHCSDNRDRNDGLYIAMKIIDKYKAESEDKDGND